MTEQLANNASSTLNGALDNVMTTVTVINGTPFSSSGTFRIIVDSEIMLVSAISGNVMTVTRGQEGTAAVSHSNGATVTQIVTASAFVQLHSDLMNIESIGHRLTLTSATPIPTSDVTGATTIYLTPYQSTRIALYDTTNSRWVMYSTGEISLSLGTLTSGVAYDIWAYVSGGSVALLLSSAWASSSSRTDAIAQQDGVWVKSSDHSRRYVGTIYTTSTTTTEDSRSKRFVWNLYNQISKYLYATETTSSWTYGTATWRSANGNAANCFEVIFGLNSDVSVKTYTMSQTSGSTTAATGVGVDSTTVNSTITFGGTSGTSGTNDHAAYYDAYLALGYHKINWIEYASGGTATFFSNSSNNSFGVAGMTGKVVG